MGILLCEQNFRDVWIRNKSVRAEIGQILRTHTQTHTHTTAAKLVVRIIITVFTLYSLIHWNLTIKDTHGTGKSDLNGEVTLLQGVICTVEYNLGLSHGDCNGEVF